MAKEALKKFGSLKRVLDSPIEELWQIKGIGEMNPFGLKLFQQMAIRYAREEIPRKILLDNPTAVFSFLQEKIGKQRKEHFFILCLDTRSCLVWEAEVSKGVLNANLIHPREVFKEAILRNAASIIVAHNHPSGDSNPSQEDLDITKRLTEAGKVIGIHVLDHVIVCSDPFLSLKSRNLF